MLRIYLDEGEYWDNNTQEFITYPPLTLLMEHSLRSISKWESYWLKPFLGNDSMTDVQLYYYIRCMITNDVYIDDYRLRSIPKSVIDKIGDYIKCPSTATTINSKGGKGGKEILTSEVIYHAMISWNIPFECQDWHLNRLTTLINICQIKNNDGNKSKKSTSKDISDRKRLNDERKRAMKTSG